MQLSDGFNGADLRNIVTEAGMFAIRDERFVAHRYFVTLADTLDVILANGLSRKTWRRQLARLARRRSMRVSPISSQRISG